MMGQQPGRQNVLFYNFCLEKHISPDHLLRQINAFLDFDTICTYLRPFYSHTGRPSIDPELMIRMLLVGYCYGIRSERRLCEEVDLNLAYRWFCQLGLEDTVPYRTTPPSPRIVTVVLENLIYSGWYSIRLMARQRTSAFLLKKSK
jgi:transposase